MIAAGSLVGAILAGSCTAIMAFNMLAGFYLIQAVARHYRDSGSMRQTGQQTIGAAARSQAVRSAVIKSIV